MRYKAVERRVAKRWGGRRVPTSGSTGVITGADVYDDTFYLEVKSWIRSPGFSEFRKQEVKAQREGKPLIMLYHETGSNDYLVTLREEDFIKLREVRDGPHEGWAEEALSHVIR